MAVKADRCIKVVKEDGEVISPASRMPYYPMVVKRGRGAILEDIDGNRYIDLFSSAAALNTGHSHPKVVAAINDQIQYFIHYTTAYMYHEPLVRLAKELIQITPGSFKKMVSFGLSGSDANDGMIKLARAYTGRSKIISFIQAYHGSTYGALSLTALSLNMRRKIGPLLPDVHHIPYPDCYRCLYGKQESNCRLECLKELENAFKYYLPPEDVAAVIIEPIAGDAGLIVPPKKYMENLYNICKQNGILFAVDEVQQGFGRTGRWFGIDNFALAPDIVVMGKAIASGMPLSAIVAREEIMRAWEAPAHLFTLGGNIVSCRAALATIEVIREENLLEHTCELGMYAKKRFNQLKEKYELIGDVRGIGLSIGIDLVKDRVTKEKAKEAAAKICYHCWERGVVVTFFANNVIRIQPPLVITKEELGRAIDVIESSIIDYMNGDIPDDVLKVAMGW